VSNPRPVLTEDDHIQLRNFVRLVLEMNRCRFMQFWQTETEPITFGQDADGRLKVGGPEFDMDGFRSFLLPFRQVAMSVSESVYYTKVIGTIGKYASQELRKRLASVRKLLIDLLDGRVQIMSLGIGPNDETISLSDVLDALVNGRYFHTGADHRELVKRLETTHPVVYLWPLVTFYICPCVRAFAWLCREIYLDGILDAADYPPNSDLPPGRPSPA
jgi:hypothetical protein